METQIKTERLLLRPWRENDAPALFKYASDPEVGPRAGWPPHQSEAESLEFIRTIFHGEGMWAIVLLETDEPIGCVGYLPQEASNIPIGENEAEVGYWVGAPHWNKGICTEALHAVVEYCFCEKGFATLWGDYFIDNPASRRVMEKCGFTDCDIETECPKLLVGRDKKVRVMKIKNR